MNVKIVFDSVDIIDGIKDSFSVHVSMEEDVFSARVVNLEPSPEMLNGKADAIINTASGEIASFPDGADGVPMKSLVVSMQPIQSLNGYSHPWPAGGGVNAINPSQFPVTLSGVNYVSVPVSQEFIQKMKTSGCAMHIDGTLGEGKTRFAIYAWDGTNNDALYIGRSQSLNTDNNFTLSGTISSNHLDNVTTIRIYAQPYTGNNTSTINNVYFQVGTDTSVWYPYSNICPISGRTGLSVYVSPTQDPDDATVYAVDWTTQAGTVYGGTLDVVTGVLVVDRGRANVLSSWSWNKSGSYPGGFYVYINNTVTGQKKDTPFMCSHAKTATSISQYVQGSCFCDGSINIRIMDGSDTVQDWKDYINAQSAAGTPIQICYELATPITYQLSPQEVKTLKGQNHVWSDAGDVDLTYVADTKLYIDNKIAQAIAAALNA